MSQGYSIVGQQKRSVKRTIMRAYSWGIHRSNCESHRIIFRPPTTYQISTSSTYQTSRSIINRLVHLANELVDVGLPVTKVTTLYVVLELSRPPATSGI